MKISTRIAKELLRQKISEISVEFAQRYGRATAEEVTEIYNDFSKKLMVVLNIKE